MAYAFDLAGALSVASGLGLIAIGALVASLRPRNAQSVSFSLFSLAWGAFNFCGGMSLLALDLATASLWTHAFVALGFVFYAPLLVFAAVATGRRGALRIGALALVSLPGIVGLLVFAVAPALFIERLTFVDGLPATVPGPLLDATQLASLLAIFVVPLLLLTIALRREAAVSDRAARTALLVAAFSSYVSYRAPDFVVTMIARGIVVDEVVAGAILATSAAATLATAFVLAVAWRRRDIPFRDVILVACTVPFGFALLELLLAQQGIALTTAGLWRIATAALFAYAIARYRLFDIEVKLANLSPLGAYLAALVVGATALWATFGGVLARSPLLALVATGGIALAAAPASRLGRALVERRAPHVRDPDYLYKRKLDVYRAALEESGERGMGAQTEQLFLTDLRKRLGISDQEHKILLLVLRSQEKYAPARSIPVRSGEAPPPRAPSKFRVERELGRGTSGRALLARDVALDRLVVIKQPLAPMLLDDDGRRQFLEEARIAARIRHPNVVGVHEVLPDEEPPMIVLEYVPGGSLEDALKRRGKLPAAEAARVMLDVLSGLHEIHKAGIVHRDLKPANILLDVGGAARVTDFGIAHAPREGSLVATLAGSQSQPGSLAFMSPEQARGDEVDARSDLYSAGAVLYLMLAGTHYVELAGASEAKARRLVQDAPMRPSLHVQGAMREVVERALAKEPGARYPDAAGMGAALRSAAVPHVAAVD